MALKIYILGLILFAICLVSPAYSPYGAWDYTGWQAVNAVLRLRPRMILDMTRPEDVIALTVIALSSLNSVFVAVSPLLFPLRRKFNRNRWFWALAVLGLASMVFIVLYMHHVGFIKVRYGYYLWLASLALVYLSFHPKLKQLS